jgi:hypothetical protein
MRSGKLAGYRKAADPAIALPFLPRLKPNEICLEEGTVPEICSSEMIPQLL